MLSRLIPQPCRLTRARSAVVWVCACSLIVVLANRVPRIPGNETSWVPSAPSQLTAKVLAKDFFVLHPPAAGGILLPHSVRLPIKAREEQPIVSISLDSHLLIRPPPST